MKIKRLDVKNIKRVREAHLEFGDKPLFIIGGDNEEGKSSVLDSIPYAMAGKRAWPERPLRDGTDHGSVEIDCGELRTKRTFTPGGGGTLTVTNAEGLVFRPPQARLDSMVNGFNFDPLAFLRAKPAAQAEQLRQMVGLDLTAEDAAIADLKVRRKAADDRKREHQAELARVTVPEGDIGDPIDLTTLAQRIAAADGHNREVDAAQGMVVESERCVTDMDRRIKDADRQIAEMEAALQKRREEVVALRKQQQEYQRGLEEWRRRVEGMQRVSADDLVAQHRSAQEHNAQVEAHRRARELAALITQRIDRAAAEVSDLEGQIGAAIAARQQRLVAATYPVPGLGLDGSTVTFDGVPLEQASGAGQLRVAVAMGLALNPELEVLIIRDGSLLDARSLHLVEEMAREAGAQILMERVGAGPECDVIMADGMVREVRDGR